MGGLEQLYLARAGKRMMLAYEGSGPRRQKRTSADPNSPGESKVRLINGKAKRDTSLAIRLSGLSRLFQWWTHDRPEARRGGSCCGKSEKGDDARATDFDWVCLMEEGQAG